MIYLKRNRFLPQKTSLAPYPVPPLCRINTPRNAGRSSAHYFPGEVIQRLQQSAAVQTRVIITPSCSGHLLSKTSTAGGTGEPADHVSIPPFSLSNTSILHANSLNDRWAGAPASDYGTVDNFSALPPTSLHLSAAQLSAAREVAGTS